MRATPPPIALPVAAAVTSVLTVVLALLAIPSAALAERWLRPVPGEVARAFHFSRGAPFAAGAHRGADLAAPPGTAVRAACAGTVAFAGRVSGQGGVVTLRCGGRRVTHLPLASIAVRAGAQLRAGATLGTLAPGHGGLHLGVRAAGDPFGYVDPLAFLPSPDRPLTPIAARPRRGRPRAIRVPPRPAPLAARLPRATPRVAAPARLRPTPHVAAPAAPVVASPGAGAPPWPVWAGVALVLCGAAGSGSIVARRHRRRSGAARRAADVNPALKGPSGRRRPVASCVCERNSQPASAGPTPRAPCVVVAHSATGTQRMPCGGGAGGNRSLCCG